MEQDAKKPPAPPVSLDPESVAKRFDAAMRKLARTPVTVPDDDTIPAAPDDPAGNEPSQDDR